jgi:hypothetical protein
MSRQPVALPQHQEVELHNYIIPTLAAAMLVWAAAEANAQSAASSEQEEPTIEACSGPEHRQFDFWVGDWEVKRSDGSVAGRNTITRVANGCGVHEYWRGAGGQNGTSINWYEPATGKWYQVWVGLGLYLRLEGGIEDGKMVLAGPRQTQQGEVVDRITWTPLDDGRVRQLWDLSSDGGQSWQTLFDGTYARR